MWRGARPPGLTSLALCPRGWGRVGDEAEMDSLLKEGEGMAWRHASLCVLHTCILIHVCRGIVWPGGHT